jgi:hypothetical protein
MDKKSYLLRTDIVLWGKFLNTIPRTEYTSINEALNEMIADRVKEHEITAIVC